MSRRNHYYGQLVTAPELNDVNDQAELRMQQLRLDDDMVGLQSGFVVSQNAVPDLSVLISAGNAYDSDGARVPNASTVNLDVSVDSNAQSTAVLVGGNEKWISVFAVFDAILSDLRPTLDGNHVYWREDDGVAWVVVQSPEVAIGGAVRPSLIPGHLLLADWRVEFGTAAIIDALIDPDPSAPLDPDTRKETMYRLTTSLPVRVISGTTPDVVQQVLTATNNHLSGADNKHPASDVIYDPTGTNFEPTDTDVGLALDHCQSTVKAWPGNLVLSPNQYRTHGTAADWRDSAYLQTYTFGKQLGPVAGGGGDLNFRIGSPASGPDGLIALDADGHYMLNMQFLATCQGPGGALYTYQDLVAIGHIHVDGGFINTPIPTPVIVAQAGNPPNIVLSLYVPPAEDQLYIKATVGAALAGEFVRLVGSTRVQRLLFP